MRIGLLGGTFDPPHLAHIALARCAESTLALDEVLFMPVNRNPLKMRGQTPAKVRLEMVRIALQNEAGFAVSDLEIVRGGPSYAVDTLQELTYVRPAEYWFLLGADTLKTVGEWKQPAKLLKLCRLGVVMRGAEETERALKNLPDYARDSIDWVEMEPSEISSTEIRQRLKAGRTVRQWLNPAVLRYIEENKLYRS